MNSYYLLIESDCGQFFLKLRARKHLTEAREEAEKILNANKDRGMDVTDANVLTVESTLSMDYFLHPEQMVARNEPWENSP